MLNNTKINFELLLPPKGIRWLVIAVLALSLFFRFFYLDHQIYWGDETYSSLRTAGYKWEEYINHIDGKEITVEDIQKFQRLTPEKNLGDTLNSLAVEDPHHPPLYYAIARFWQQLFGDSVAVRRALPSLLSLLLWPAIYWLCWELFNSSLIAWIAVTTSAVSPFFLLYSLEVRQYSLWTVTIALSSAALLSALRKNNVKNWSIYAITVALSLYTFLFSALILFAQGIYVLLNDNLKVTKKGISYLLATGLGIILFSPWLYIIISNIQQILKTNSDKTNRVSIIYLVVTWLTDITRTFFDININFNDPFSTTLNFTNPFTYLIPLAMVLIVYSLHFLWRTAPKSSWLFVFVLVGVPYLCLMGPDVILGGTRSINVRYFTPCVVGLQIAVAYMIAQNITLDVHRRRVWQLVLLLVLSGSIVSCIMISTSQSWWTKYTDYFNPMLAKSINASERPLLVSDSPWRLFSLSYLLDNKVKMVLFYNPEKLPPIQNYNQYSDVFLLNTYRGKRSDNIRKAFEENTKLNLEKIYQGELVFKNRLITLWKARKG